MEILFNLFPGGAKLALTMSYDGGNRADERLVGIFNRHGIRGTFHLCNQVLEAEDGVGRSAVRQLYEGFEISAHTVLHPFLDDIPASRLLREILDNRMYLEELAQAPVRGMSYPFGSASERVVRALPHYGIEYARTTGSAPGFQLPSDPLRWCPSCHHNQGLMAMAEAFITGQGMSKRRLERPRLLYVWGHSYEFDNKDNWDVMEAFCAYAGGREDIWYATSIEILDYMKALENLKFTARLDRVANPGALDVWLSVEGAAVRVPGGSQVLLQP